MKGHAAVMEQVYADWIRYNANTRNKDVGDCAKRALSVAYSMDYDEVSRELNRIKRSIGASEYSQTRVIRKFMEIRGDAMKRVPVAERITETEFCEQHPSGVYVAFSGEAKDKWSTHMIAIVDGDIYDSWNSVGWYIYEWAKVSTGSSARYEFSFMDILPDMEAYIDNYINKLNDTFNLGYDIGVGSIVVLDNYTARFVVVVDFAGEAPRRSVYWGMGNIGHRIVMKLNPRLTEEENISSLQSKIKQKIYDWLYEVRRELKKSEKLETVQFHPHIYSSSTKKFIMNLPEWCWPLIFSVESNPNADPDSYQYKYVVYMDQLPDDPRQYEVRFAADTLRELKDELNMYKKNFSRLDYEY